MKLIVLKIDLCMKLHLVDTRYRRFFSGISFVNVRSINSHEFLFSSNKKKQIPSLENVFDAQVKWIEINCSEHQTELVKSLKLECR